MSRSSPNSHAFSHPRDRVIVGRRARGSSLEFLAVAISLSTISTSGQRLDVTSERSSRVAACGYNVL